MVAVTALRSDVYHLLHMCHVLIKVTMSYWAGEFINTEWWGFCVICWQFLQWIIYSISDFRPAMPKQFCNLHYISFIYWELTYDLFENFSYILQVFMWNVWCCTVSKFYHAHHICITYCSGGGFLFVFIWAAEWQLIHMVELISTGDGEIMEKLDNIEIKLLVFAALKED